MEQIYKVLILIFLFSITSVFLFSYKKRCEETRKLERDARIFFETICQNILTSVPYLPYEIIKEESRIFEISGTLFFIVKLNLTNSKLKQKIIEQTFEFIGPVIINVTTGKVYSYSCFESYLSKMARKTSVSGYFVEYL